MELRRCTCFWHVISCKWFALNKKKTKKVFQNSCFVFQDYIAVKEKYARFTPHSAGRYAAKRFRKAQCPIVERLTNSLMMKGRNNGKKLMAVRIVKHAFEIIYLLTDKNPLHVSINYLIRIFFFKLIKFLNSVLARTMQFEFDFISNIKLLGVETWTILKSVQVYSSTSTTVLWLSW